MRNTLLTSDSVQHLSQGPLKGVSPVSPADYAAVPGGFCGKAASRVTSAEGQPPAGGQHPGGRRAHDRAEECASEPPSGTRDCVLSCPALTPHGSDFLTLLAKDAAGAMLGPHESGTARGMVAYTYHALLHLRKPNPKTLRTFCGSCNALVENAPLTRLLGMQRTGRSRRQGISSCCWTRTVSCGACCGSTSRAARRSQVR